MKLEFALRAKRIDTDTAKRWRWQSACGRYRVVKAVSKYGLPRTFYAIYLDGMGESMLSNQCRTKDGAVTKCQEHADAREAKAAQKGRRKSK